MLQILRSLATIILVLASSGASMSADLDPSHVQFFETKIRPVLVRRCYKCHSTEAKEAHGQLRLDSRDNVLRGGESGKLFEPDNIQESLLLQAIRHEGLEMPPDGKLPERVIKDFETWLKMGAPDPREGTPDSTATRAIDIEEGRKLWAYRPLTNPTPPEVEAAAEYPRPIDRFIVARLEAQGLSLAPPVDRYRFIRRAYFDLIGLPPSPKEIEAFVEDGDSQALDKVIDHLLASDHYGERWGRFWLDIARFAESNGYERDEDRPHAYPYRDFVIKALNQDMPYDDFVRLQLAGDLLDPENPQAQMATGFLVAGVKNELATVKEFQRDRYDELDDMAATMCTAMLGVTIGCARCHDHKYDPFPQRDYYRLISAFGQTQSENTELEGITGGNLAYVARDIVERELNNVDGGNKFSISTDVHFLVRGNPSAPQELVSPAFPQVLMRAQEGEKRWMTRGDEQVALVSPRVALANWITDVEVGAGHLLARVIVNRLWLQHMGHSIVATPSDLGTRSGQPSHPQLLDWLASELIRNDWRLKPIHRAIMRTKAYAQGYAENSVAEKHDPENHLLWRRPLRRLEAEVIRDAMVAASGLIDLTMYGPGSLDEATLRRSVYLTVKRTRLIPFLQLFDAPDALQSEGQRQATTVAPQSLLLLNNPKVRHYAENFAQRIERLQAKSIDESVTKAFLIALARPPSQTEQEQLRAFVEASITNAKKLLPPDNAQHVGIVDLCHVLLCSNEFVYVE